MINIKYVQTNIPKNDLDIIVDGLSSLDIWSISKNPGYWSNYFIDADYIYRAHRPSTRIVEETGLLVQNIVNIEFATTKTIFPDFFQIVRYDKDFVIKDKLPKNIICQTVTYLNGSLKNKTVIIYNNSDFYKLEDNNEDTIYALCTFWTYEKNPMYRGWFINKYFRKFL